MKDIEFFKRHLEIHGDYDVCPEAEYERILFATGILSENKGKTILDAGCGSGAFSEKLNMLGYHSVTGMDLSAELIEKACQKNKAGTVKYRVGNVLKMPFDDESFDIIFCGGMLHHLPEQLKETAAESARVLKNGGKVYFFEPYLKCVNSYLRYKLLCYNRTEEECALEPLIVNQAFTAGGFKDFKWKKLKGVKCVYSAPNSGFAEKAVGGLRKLINETLLSLLHKPRIK